MTQIRRWFQPESRALAYAGFEVSPGGGTILVDGLEVSLALALKRQSLLSLVTILAEQALREKPDWIEEMTSAWEMEAP